MRFGYFFLLAAAVPISLTKPLSSGTELFDLDSYSDTPTAVGESIPSNEADLNTQALPEPILFNSPESSEDPNSDLFGTQDYSTTLSNIPDTSNILFAQIPSSDSSPGQPPTPNGIPSSIDDPVENFENFLDEKTDQLLRFLGIPPAAPHPLDKECEEKTGGRIPLCCTDLRNLLPWAYGCTPYNEANLDCKFYNYQHCCSGYNPVDHEGLGCTRGFYGYVAEGSNDGALGIET